MLHQHAITEYEQISKVCGLTGVVRGERRGGVAHWSQNGYRTKRRERSGDDEKLKGWVEKEGRRRRGK